MTQENKELLIKDLCARLPYGVKVFDNSYGGVDVFNLVGYDGEDFLDDDGYWYRVEDCKPYLFPQSDMTQEQMVEYYNTLFVDDKGVKYLTVKSLDWLYKNHIDIYGFISMGLAIDATGLNIYKTKIV
jgi:hypothetical protein